MSQSSVSRRAVQAAVFILALAPALSVLAQSAPVKPAAPRPAQAAQPNQNKGPTPEQMFAKWDTEKNKSLSLAEFKSGLEDMREASVMARLQMQFQAADSNRNGTLEAAEYGALPVIKNAGSTAPPMSTFDLNKSQGLDFQEFLGFVEAAIKNARANTPPR